MVMSLLGCDSCFLAKRCDRLGSSPYVVDGVGTFTCELEAETDDYYLVHVPAGLLIEPERNRVLVKVDFVSFRKKRKGMFKRRKG
jgi:hypothetical protein